MRWSGATGRRVSSDSSAALGLQRMAATGTMTGPRDAGEVQHLVACEEAWAMAGARCTVNGEHGLIETRVAGVDNCIR